MKNKEIILQLLRESMQTVHDGQDSLAFEAYDNVSDCLHDLEDMLDTIIMTITEPERIIKEIS